MKKFELTNINFEDQIIHLRVNHPIKNGYIVARDIDLGTTMYKMKIWDVNPGLICYFHPAPKFVFDFNRDDFGGFEIQLLEGEDAIETQFVRLRYTDMAKHKQNINDYNHPVFMNYREFFVEDRYKEFDLDNCSNVIDVGASVGLFTKYMLNRGAQNVTSVECDDRSITALYGNFINNPKVNIVGKALSNSEGEKTLYWKDDNPLVNSLDIEGSEFQHQENPNTKIVQTTTLENLISSLNWGSIDLLKIDIEGSEWEVIDSTPDSVFSQINKILLEYHWPQGRLQPVIDRFATLGFYYKFEPGCDGSEENGTMFFFK